MQRLNACGSQKAQYLKIQASCLVGRYPSEALRLIGYARSVQADTFWEQELCLYESRCLFLLKDYDAAVQKAFESVAWRRKQPGVHTDCAYFLAELVLRCHREGEYEKCADILREFHEDSPFPLDGYRYHGLRALLQDAQGHRSAALAELSVALSFARLSENALNNPQKRRLGTFTGRLKRDWLHKSLIRLNRLRNSLISS